MGGNRGSYLVSSLGPVAVVPLPPTPKITEISANNGTQYVPFSEGWKTETCEMIFEAGHPELGSTSFSILVKGENLTEEYLRTLVCTIPYDGEQNSVDIEAVNPIDGGFNLYITTNTVRYYDVGDNFQITIAGVTSGIMKVSDPG